MVLSTLETYNFYTRDVTMTRTRFAEQDTVSREADYYATEIKNITSIDDFLENDRLYNYAMVSYGLEEMIYAKGMIKKVLESDLTDENSFANLLTDTRYKEFAAAFDFGLTTGTEVIQTDDQQSDLIEAYEQRIADSNKNQQEELAYFKAVMATITEAIDLFKYPRAVTFILETMDLPTENYDFDMLFNSMTSDPSDPDGYYQTVLQVKYDEWNSERAALQDQYTAAKADGSKTDEELAQMSSQISSYYEYTDKLTKFMDLAGMFSFNADGSLPADGIAQTDAQFAAMEERYLLYGDDDRVTYGVALLNKQYYEEQIPQITRIDDIILYNERLKTITYTAYGIDMDMSRSEMLDAMVDFNTDPEAALSTWGQSLSNFFGAFNFDLSNGNVISGQEPQSTTDMESAMSNYLVTYDDIDQAQDEEDIADFKRFIGLTIDLDDFLQDILAANIVRNFALKAYGIGEDEFSKSELKKIFTSDPADTDSYLNKLNDERLYKLVKVLNFDTEGKISAPRTAQSENEITRVAKAYYTAMTLTDSSESTAAAAEDEVEYYRNQMVRISNVDEFVDDQRLIDFLAIAEGVDPATLTPELLRQLFTSDKDDPESFYNQQTDQTLQSIGGSYNFSANGAVLLLQDSGPQTFRGLFETANLYITQMIETDAGESSVGARLALYFERTADTITSVYDIIADSALGEFIRTAFSIPEEVASSDVDKQAAYYERFVTIEDLQDPEKVEELVNRFIALYDVANFQDTTVSTLFGNSSTFSSETIAAYAQYRSQL